VSVRVAVAVAVVAEVGTGVFVCVGTGTGVFVCVGAKAGVLFSTLRVAVGSGAGVVVGVLQDTKNNITSVSANPMYRIVASFVFQNDILQTALAESD
jgi:hypothetical protein